MAMRSIADVFAALKDSRFEDGWDALSVEDVLRHLIFEAGVFNVVEDLDAILEEEYDRNILMVKSGSILYSPVDGVV